MKSLYHRTIGLLSEFARSRHGLIAAVMLAAMFGLGLGSMAGNSAIVDEIAHIPAGYSYLHYGDYRLNPEHPPLIKDLAGLPLQFMHLRFPDDQVSWTTDVNGQWEAGWNFLYHVGNNADMILFWSRLPVLLLAIVFGGLLYWICRRRWGTGVALLTLFFYTLSPNILAHSSLVTTDLGATVFIFLAIVAFARFVERPNRNNFILLSLGLGGAQIAKFSAFLLYPFLGLVVLGVVWLAKNPKKLAERFKIYLGGFIGASAVSIGWVWLFYIPHTWNMSNAVQDRLIEGSLTNPNVLGIAHMLTSLNDIPILKSLVQYVLGLTMVFGRVAGGNVTYFNGQVTDQSFHAYFPELFAVKTQVALLILLLVVIAVGLGRFVWYRQVLKRAKDHFRSHVLEWTLGLFAAFYFLVSVAGNLNLGIRHVLPIYVPIFILVAIATVKYWRQLAKTRWAKTSSVVLALLLLWYGGSTVAAYPSYLSYFNELIGGSANADKYFSDSSVDWGQDLRRLKVYTDQHPEINRIAVDYFGGGVPAYYFCNRKYDAEGRLVASAAGYDCSNSVFEEWHSQYGRYTGQYIAISETFLENDLWYSEVNGTPGYDYLRQRKPIAKIGGSIYVYKLY
ncbi:MAG: hypothetical protein JWN01_227 [Patescibacteria group bacterium]|nr:hypothetical protein [Patescibacteria group bacterium]